MNTSEIVLLIGNACLVVAFYITFLEVCRVRRYVRENLNHMHLILNVMRGLLVEGSDGKQYKESPVCGDIRMASKFAEDKSKTSFAREGSGAIQPPK